MSHQDNAVFADASGRRNRLMKYVAVLIGVGCVGFVAVVVVGLFGAAPSGGPLPWGDGRKADPPAQAERSPSPTVPAPGAAESAGPASSAVPAAASSSSGASSPGAPASSAAPASKTSPAAPAPEASAAPSDKGHTGDTPGRGTPAAPDAPGKGHDR
ncbi:hypothetical protein J7I98_31530 [Streptomyces sp. ISL-98]|uniref:hypothetical protein n=1 Tax=Streptomyces sp. ISL-98 TaxID=2819192 RepID=UPI001BE97113|nr:hypothetical protein [Streptomyces sp. ISL-98]MBT2510308.1 hypothetical protein [Streptomyces sp. ISL-98]